jgi:hypothetical protein
MPGTLVSDISCSALVCGARSVDVHLNNDPQLLHPQLLQHRMVSNMCSQEQGQQHVVLVPRTHRQSLQDAGCIQQRRLGLMGCIYTCTVAAAAATATRLAVTATAGLCCCGQGPASSAHGDQR